jgi:uncharacterized protein (TIGR03435 family)
LVVPAIQSQTEAPPELLAFEVASIRPNPGLRHVLLGFSSSGSNVRLTGWYAKSLIMEACNLRDYEVVYSPVTVLDVYDIAAKAESGMANVEVLVVDHREKPSAN